MKTKLKKWHLALMSFMALFIAVFASLFNLKADPVDDETGEILYENWELSTVFYDSTVDTGVTPLTSITWDASDGDYRAGTPRTITVQINYKNDSAVTDYDIGELQISIPNLAYIANKNKAQLSASIIVGANDSTHTGYDWNLESVTAPSPEYPELAFSNAVPIQQNSNFEGSIQIQYTFTPADEYNILSYDAWHDIEDITQAELDAHEWFIDECVHGVNTSFEATISKSKTIKSQPYYYYGSSWKEEDHFWEYYDEDASQISIYILPDADLKYVSDVISIYNANGERVHMIQGGINFKGDQTYVVDGNYAKITFKTTYSTAGKGFFATFKSDNFQELKSNSVDFNYTRTYSHPWHKPEFKLLESAYKINAYDGLGSNPTDYIWVRYYVEADNIISFITENPIGQGTYYICVMTPTLNITTELPEGCVAYDSQGKQLTPTEDNLIRIPVNNLYPKGFSYYTYIYIGYPKSIYNEENDNMVFTNICKLNGRYVGETEESELAESSANVNLANYEFSYTGNLYGITKLTSSSQTLYSQNINSGKNPSVAWALLPSVRYMGTELTVRIGDDVLFASNQEGNYEKLTDDDYYYDSISVRKLYNCNGMSLNLSKYDVQLYVRYKNTTEYVPYGDPVQNYYTTTTFTEEDGVVGFYYQINNMDVGLQTSTSNYSASGDGYPYSYIRCSTVFKPTNPVPDTGTLYNFTYLNVFSEDESGNSNLLNPVSLDSYNTTMTKTDIAAFDMETYGQYMQRAVSSQNWTYYDLGTFEAKRQAYKKASAITQNVEKEIFTSNFTIAGGSYHSINTSIIPENLYWQQVESKTEGISYIYIEDILPEGMELTSTEQELLDSLAFHSNVPSSYSSSFFYYERLYNNKGELYFTSNEEAIAYLKEHTTITITENWDYSNRTRIFVTIDLSEKPIVTTGLFASLVYNFAVSYDNFLEFGKNYTNTVQTWNNLFETKSSASASISITSVVSTHQDVTTYVKTNYNNFTTKTADSDTNTEYQYKLRVRTGAADVTNLILYTNIEEAQPERTRWKGEFLSINTSFAQNKGYTVKPYYSENLTADNLYNEDGTLNSDWKEFFEPQEEILSNGLAITFNSQSQTENNCDYVIIYYRKDGKTYQTQKLMGTNIAGKTVTIPSTDFYLYWYTDGSVCSYYGFSIDSIVPSHVENITDTTGSIPSYTVTELQDNNYPDSAFDSYTHGYYGNGIRKLWHYTYTGEKELIKPFVPGTDTSKVKSLAFEYLDNEGNPAILPANSLTYVLINMKSPSDENIKTLARMDCRTQWNALDEFDQPVDFITGINSNVVKVALPNSVDEDSAPNISLKFTKEIQGTDSQFENMKLNKANPQTFMIRLTSLIANDDGSYNQVTALLKSNQELIISQIPVGTYLLEELNDNYFDFVDFEENNKEDIVINGVIFERTDQGYVLTISEDLTENVEFNIKVTNEIEPFRPYEDKDNKENLFLKNKINDNIIDPDDPEGH